MNISNPLRRTTLLYLLFGLLFWPTACDRYGEIRSGLNAMDQARFNRGQKAATPCWSCHDVTGADLKIGPPLQGLIGRPAGSVTGYPYSPASRASSFIWTEAKLDAFLASPQSVIPGNRMIAPRITNPEQRADLVFFLSKVTRPPLLEGLSSASE